MELSAEEGSPEGQRAAVKQRQKYTAEEEERILAATSDGKEALRSNLERAERLFQRCLSLNPAFTKPYMALGDVYAKQGRVDEAKAAYRKYVQSSPDAPDRFRVEKRLADLDGKSVQP